MRSDQCKFCNRRKCNHRIVTVNLVFDEIACTDHVKELYSLADETLGSPGGLRWHIGSTGKLKRGEPVPEPSA